MDILAARTPQLRLTRSERADGVVCLAVAGEVDMSTGNDFRRTVSDALHEPGLRTLLLDIARLRFIDSNGVAVLIGAHRDAEDGGVVFALINAGRRIRSVLELMGVYDMLTGAQP